MAEASRGRVTITLGRSGQVIKRAGTGSDAEYSGSLPGAGSKRSVRDRLGNNSDCSLLRGREASNKRQRGDTNLSANGVDDFPISKDDLRLKLMRKNVFRRAQSDNDKKVLDLREKLSRTGQPPASGIDRRQRMPESKDKSILGRIPPTRSADDLPGMNSSRSSYSAWTLDHLRHRSPDRLLGPSMVLSPPRRVEDSQRRPLSRTFDDVRVIPYMSDDVVDPPRSFPTAPFTTRSTLPTTSAKPAAPGPPLLGQLPPTGSILQKSSYTGDEQQTVDGLLHSLGLGKYAILFKAEEVDMTALKQMGENDLKELGIPMGPRKKILRALIPRSKRQT